MNAPCARVDRAAPIGKNSMSPLPSNFSAPGMSRMVRLSTWLLTANAMRDGMFALIKPVITSTDGRWVATTMWMPVARVICARRQITSSKSAGATIIRSASSSTMMTRYGRRSTSVS